MAALKNMSLAMSMGKDERKFRLEQEIRARRALTVSSCARIMELSKNTIRTYLKEMNISIYDDENKEMTKVNGDNSETIYPFLD